MRVCLMTLLVIVSVSGLVVAQVGTVDSHQKISDTEGNFTGTLDDDDYFGWSLGSPGDLDGDGVSDVVVGVALDDDGGRDRGAVWVLFLNANGTVKSHQKISDTNGNFTGTLNDSARFGNSVSSMGDLDGDGVTDLAVGATGAVWILFLNADGTVKSHQQISNTLGGFGSSVVSPGDLDDDSVPDLVVGARSDDDGGFQRGAVWVLFMNADGTVKAQQKISDTEGNFTGALDDEDLFGSSLGSPGDLDGDAIPDVTVGAPQDDDGGVNRGAVWVLFMNADGTVKSHQKISDTEGNFTGTLHDIEFLGFGTSVASLGDLDGDAINDMVVGVGQDEEGFGETGAVWVLFMNANGTVKSQQKISATQGNFTGPLDHPDWFGFSVTSPGDVNGDGTVDLVVGAPQDDDGSDGNERGAVWVLFLNGAGTSIEAAIDVQPGDCPNAIKNKGHGTLTVAVLGTLDLDVRDINVSTVRLEGLAPTRFSIEDVADPFVGEISGCSDCITAEPSEGFADLVLKFNKSALVGALGTVSDRQCLAIQLTGELHDGTPIEGTDFILILD